MTPDGVTRDAGGSGPTLPDETGRGPERGATAHGASPRSRSARFAQAFLGTCAAVAAVAILGWWVGRPLHSDTAVVALIAFPTGLALDAWFAARTSWGWKGTLRAWAVAAAVALGVAIALIVLRR